MARQPGKATLMPSVDVVDGDYSEADPMANEDEGLAFEAFRSGFTSEEMGNLRVHRIPVDKTGMAKQASKSVFLFSCPIDKYDYDGLCVYLRDNYGTGTYRIIGTKSGARGFGFNRIVEIEAPKSAPVPVAAGGTDSIALVNAFREAMQENSRRIEEILEKRTSGQDSQMAAMTTAIAMISQIKEIFQPQNNPQTGLIQELEKVKLINEMFGDGGGSRESGNAWIGEAIRTFGGPLAALATREIAAKGPPRIAPVALPDAGMTSPPAVQPPPARVRQPNPITKENTNMQLISLQKQVSLLLGQAKLNADPVEMASTILDATPEDKQDALYEFISDAACIDKMELVNSEVKQYRLWFENLRNAILAEFEPEPGEGVDSASAEADTSADTLNEAGDAGADASGFDGNT